MRTSLFFLFLAATAPLSLAQIDRDAGKLYQDFCASCHGGDMRGGKAGSLLDSYWRNSGDQAGIEKSIRDGVPNSGMPAFGKALSAGEIRALVVLIQETGRRDVSPELRGAHPLPEGVQENGGQKFRVEEFVSGLDVPWALTFLTPDEALVTERAGRLRRIVKGVLQEEPVADVPAVWARDEGGLLCVAADPAYEATGWIYLSFSDPGEKNTAMTKVVRGKIRDNRWIEQQTIFQAPRTHYRESGMHFGSRLLFSGAYLYFTVGERGAVGEAQDLRKPNGKVHRVFHDGTVPPDNPFVAVPGAWPSIWSYGNRNPQGLALEPGTGALWETEHGPRGGDELNRIVPGQNYGWPVVTFGMNYDGTPVSGETEREGMVSPVLQWTPSIATCPIMFYTGTLFPGWKNNLFLGSLAQQEFLRFEMTGGKPGKEVRFFKNLGRVRDIQTGPDGFIYIALETPGALGRIIRLLPAR